MAGWETVLLAGASAGLAALAVRRWAAEPRSRRLWWLAGGLAALGPVAAAHGSVPTAFGLPAAGLVAAAAIDAVEGRIPTPLAHATTVLSLGLLVGQALAIGDADPLVTGVGLTAVLVGVVTVGWLAGGIGFGDVRLAAATATASARGLAGLVGMAWIATVVAAGIVVATRIAGRRRRTVPFGPALAVGWFFSIWTA